MENIKFYKLIQRSLGILLILLSSHLQANEQYATLLTKNPIIDSIEIKGLERTKEKVVRRELLFKEGDPLSSAALLESIQELKNLQIFSFVRPYLTLLPDNKVKLTIELEEKWSIIPFLSYSAGGGTRFFRAGVYDINWLGKYIETGARYENWNGEHGGLLWFYNPRFMNTHATLGTVLGSTQQPRKLYNTDGDLQGEFVLKRQEFSLTYKKEFNKIWELGILFEYFDDEFHSITSTSFIDPKTANLLTTRHKSKTLLNTVIIKFGKLNYDIDVISGRRSDLLLSHSNSELISDYSFNKVKWANQAYWQLPWRSYIAAHFTLAATDTKLLQQYYYVGGFQHIRGYRDGQFRNRSYWQANLEYRIPSYRSRWLILQHIFFIDAANAAMHIHKLNQFENNVYSAGTGIRLLSPKIYSFNGRLDFALLTSGKSQTSISLGTQHFF